MNHCYPLDSNHPDHLLRSNHHRGDDGHLKMDGEIGNEDEDDDEEREGIVNEFVCCSEDHSVRLIRVDFDET